MTFFGASKNVNATNENKLSFQDQLKSRVLANVSVDDNERADILMLCDLEYPKEIQEYLLELFKTGTKDDIHNYLDSMNLIPEDAIFNNSVSK